MYPTAAFSLIGFCLNDETIYPFLDCNNGHPDMSGAVDAWCPLVNHYESAKGKFDAAKARVEPLIRTVVRGFADYTPDFPLYRRIRHELLGLCLF